jgi:hypothetical protein
MTDKMFMAILVMAGVACLALFFIHRALTYRKRMKQTTSQESAMDCSAHSEPSAWARHQEAYETRFIYAPRTRFASDCRIKVRPQYYEQLLAIVDVVGSRHLSLADYLDRVLQEHLEENREHIERFCHQYEEDSVQK